MQREWLQSIEKAAKEAHTMEVGYNDEFYMHSQPETVLQLARIALAALNVVDRAVPPFFGYSEAMESLKAALNEDA